jgi:hypothetical protein
MSKDEKYIKLDGGDKGFIEPNVKESLYSKFSTFMKENNKNADMKPVLIYFICRSQAILERKDFNINILN